jgi:hypothetical protein
MCDTIRSNDKSDPQSKPEQSCPYNHDCANCPFTKATPQNIPHSKQVNNVKGLGLNHS